MFLNLAHTKLDAFALSKQFLLCCYEISLHLPSEEKFNMVQQLRRAALSVHLNLAEGCSRKSAVERKRFYEIARGSLIEVDTILDAAIAMDYYNGVQLEQLGGLIIRTFQVMSKMIRQQESTHD